ncbi:MAG: hypothetical protein K2K33_07510, partial [Muribaculaceae bacterium]|nr:hypothetical protein [Muribaculaceae bacterium]
MLVINKIDISCNCLKIIDYPDSLFAGQTGEITGEIDFKNQSRHLRKSIFITYN